MGQVPEGYSDRAWIKVYDAVLDDVELQTMPAEEFRFLVNCWLLARRGGNRLGRSFELAFKLRVAEVDAKAWCADLVAKNYLVERDGARLEIRNWDYWQAGKSSTERSRESRQKKKTADATDCNNDLLHVVAMQHDATKCNNDLLHVQRDATPCNKPPLHMQHDATNCNAPLLHVENDATNATPKYRREEKRKEEREEGGQPPSALESSRLVVAEGPDPDELFQTAAKFACEQLPAGGDVNLTASAMRGEFQKSASFEGNPAGFCLAYTASVRKWRAAYDANPDLRTKQAQWWTRDGTYSQAPPAARAPRRFGPVDLKAGMEVEDGL